MLRGGRRSDFGLAATGRWCFAKVGFVSGRSGISSVDLAVLEVTEACASRRYVACAHVIGAIEERTGLSPESAYDALLSLARSWTIAVPLIDTMGNIGDRLYGPASEPQHTECRVSRAGQTVLDAEAARIAPVPAGLVNGTMHGGGIQPPLQPGRVIAALRHILAHPRASDREILAIAGPPFSVTGCAVTGDLDTLNAGGRIMLRQTGRISLTGNPIPSPRPVSAARQTAHKHHVGAAGSSDRLLASAQLIIESLPPDAYPGDVGAKLSRHGQAQAGEAENRSSRALPIARVFDIGSIAVPVRILITLVPGTNPATARDQIAAVDGVTTQAAASYPAPLADLLRSWADRYRGEDLAASLNIFEYAIEET
jgi:hypothetical protein